MKDPLLNAGSLVRDRATLLQKQKADRVAKSVAGSADRVAMRQLAIALLILADRTDPNRRRIREWARAGMSLSVMMSLSGLSGAEVRQLCDGVKREDRARAGRPRHPARGDVLKHLRAGLTAKRAGELCGVSPKSVGKWRAEWKESGELK